MKTCLYMVPGEGRCLHMPMVHGYCMTHVGSSPEERAAMVTLLGCLDSAKRAMDDVGNTILRSYIVFSDVEIPDELRREYRALWHRHNYLVNVRNGRRPGDPLPVEVAMR